MTEETTYTGVVDFFNNVSGWGKVVCDSSNEPLFIHHRDIVDERFYPDNDIEKFRTLKRGQRVSFAIEHNAKPMNAAVRLKLVDDNAQEE